MQASFHLQQQSVGGDNADSGRETLCVRSQLLQSQPGSAQSRNMQCQPELRIPRGGIGLCCKPQFGLCLGRSRRGSHRLDSCNSHGAHVQVRPLSGRSKLPRRPPRLFKSDPRSPLSAAVSSSRRIAWEACRAADNGRNRIPSVLPRSAANCKRRMSRERMSLAHPNTTSQAPDPRHCSSAHNAFVPAPAIRGASSPDWIMRIRFNTIPCAASAGAKGCNGGCTQAHHLAEGARVNADNAGSRSVSSPIPKWGIRISIKPVRGQPPPGNRASREAKPLGTTSAGATRFPRQSAGCSSNRVRSGEALT